MTPDDRTLSVGHSIGSWRIEGTLGRGGTAIVYAGRHAETGAPCALKILRQPDEDLRRRMVREGRAQSSLRHPHVAAVLECLEWKGRPVLVLERVDGPDLGWLLERGPLTGDGARRLGTGILLGVEATHRAGLIHRDLKPANILLDIAGERLVPRISDFGLVKMAQSEGYDGATRSGQSFGTLGYTAPEQLEDAGRVDQRADVFSLGAVLYEMIGGRPAFRGRTMFDVHFRIKQGEYAPLARLRPEVPQAIGALIARCLTADRELRPESVAQLLEGWLEGWLEGAEPLGSLDGEEAQQLIARYRGAPPPLEHVAPARLGADDPTPEELAHVASCPRCRIGRQRLRRFLAEEG